MQLNVPHVQQLTPWSCSLACLEMVTRYHGCHDLRQVEAFHRLKIQIPGSLNQWGVTNHSILVEAAKLGFQPSAVQVNYRNPKDMLESIQHHLEDLGCPLIATQRVRPDELFLGHSRVVVGYEKDAVIFHDPAPLPVGMPACSFVQMSAGDFAKMWFPNRCISGGEALLIKKLAKS